jgi:hypothetical protein
MCNGCGNASYSMGGSYLMDSSPNCQCCTCPRNRPWPWGPWPWGPGNPDVYEPPFGIFDEWKTPNYDCGPMHYGM